MSSQEKKRVLIIGGGFSGAMTAVQLLRTGAPFSIVLFEGANRTARGIAYSASSPEILLNVPAARMHPIAEEPSAFIDWARANSSNPLLKGRTPEPKDFLPRGLFGEFLEDLLNRSLAANPASSLEIVKGTATSLSLSSGEWRAGGKFNRIYSGEYAVLAPGNPPPTTPKQLESLSAERLVNPWADLDLSGLPLGDSVLTVGTGLTAIDVVVRLNELGYRGKFLLCSRHGLLPSTHLEDPLSPPPGTLTGSKLPLRAFVREVRRETDAITAAGKPWQTAIDTLRPKHQEIWRSFTPADRARFVRHLSPYWEIHRHRVAPQLAALVSELRRAGRLEIHKGSIHSAAEEPDGVVLSLRRRGSSEISTLKGSHLFLCTGPSRTVSAWQSPLIEKLLASGDLEPDELGFGFRIPQSRAGNRLYLLGSALRGTLWETTAVRELAQQALQTAKSISNSQ